MKAFITKLTLLNAHNCINSSFLEHYLVDRYQKETFIDKSSFSLAQEPAKFTYLQDEKLVYLMVFDSIVNQNDMNLTTNNGMFFPSNRYNIEIGVDGNLDIYQYIGSQENLSILLNRISAICECNDNRNNFHTLLDLDNWISTNSKSYNVKTIVDLKNNSKSKLNKDYQYTAIDNFNCFNNEIGNWILTHIDENLSPSLSLTEFISNYCE